MNGIEKITARIAAEAGAEAEAILAEARAQAAEIGAEFEKKAQEEYQSCLRRGTVETEQRVQRLGNTARLEAKKEVLALKQELIAAAYDKAREKILNLPQAEYVAFLAAQAGKASVSGDEVIALNEADRASIGAQVVEADLARALEEVPTRTAVLDVTYPEPPRPDCPLLGLPNVFFTPHIAGSAGDEVCRMGEFMVEEFRRYTSGMETRYQVTLKMLETMA